MFKLINKKAGNPASGKAAFPSQVTITIALNFLWKKVLRELSSKRLSIQKALKAVSCCDWPRGGSL